MEEKQMQLAKNTFATLCKMLDKDDWSYDKIEDEFMIKSGARGEDLPIDFRLFLDAERSVAVLYSTLPFRIAEEKRTEAAIAICAINDSLLSGCFDFDYDTGAIVFRMTNTFRESLLSEQAFHFMLHVSLSTVDDYNDKLLMLSKGMITLEQLKKDI